MPIWLGVYFKWAATKTRVNMVTYLSKFENHVDNQTHSYHLDDTPHTHDHSILLLSQERSSKSKINHFSIKTAIARLNWSQCTVISRPVLEDSPSKPIPGILLTVPFRTLREVRYLLSLAAFIHVFTDWPQKQNGSWYFVKKVY